MFAGNTVWFVNEPPRIEIVDGVATVHLRSGSNVSQLAMPLCTLYKSIAVARQAVKRHAEGDETVIAS